MGRNSGHRAGPIPEEICARVEALRTTAGTTGVKLRPPLLMLGTSERVRPTGTALMVSLDPGYSHYPCKHRAAGLLVIPAQAAEAAV
jgi:hypothetical protein